MCHGRQRLAWNCRVKQELTRNGSGTKEADEGSALSVDSSLSEGSSSREHRGDC